MTRKTVMFLLAALIFLPVNPLSAQVTGAAQEADDGLFDIPFINLSIRDAQSNQDISASIQLLLLIAVITLAPSFMLLLTSFLRISIVLDFVRRALSLQQVPPSQVIMGIALFLTVFIMWPVFTDVYDNAVKPFNEGEISVTEMYYKAEAPLRLFMFNQVRENPDSIKLFMRMRGLDKPNSLADVPTYVLIPAFVLHEITVAFRIGILIYMPFIIIDMVVASTLMSMGMIMLPPVMISLPFKLILFVLVDGWHLIMIQLIKSFGVGV